jgi:sulfite reductase alpha subunit-like flavoprotein
LKIAEEEGKFCAADAEKYIRQMEKNGRYVVEAWA